MESVHRPLFATFDAAQLGLLTASSNGSFLAGYVLNGGTGFFVYNCVKECLFPIPHPERTKKTASPVCSLSVSNDGRHLLVATKNALVFLWSFAVSDDKQQTQGEWHCLGEGGQKPEEVTASSRFHFFYNKKMGSCVNITAISQESAAGEQALHTRQAKICNRTVSLAFPFPAVTSWERPLKPSPVETGVVFQWDPGGILLAVGVNGSDCTSSLLFFNESSPRAHLVKISQLLQDSSKDIPSQKDPHGYGSQTVAWMASGALLIGICYNGFVYVSSRLGSLLRLIDTTSSAGGVSPPFTLQCCAAPPGGGGQCCAAHPSTGVVAFGCGNCLAITELDCCDFVPTVYQLASGGCEVISSRNDNKAELAENSVLAACRMFLTAPEEVTSQLSLTRLFSAAAYYLFGWASEPAEQPKTLQSPGSTLLPPGRLLAFATAIFVQVEWATDTIVAVQFATKAASFLFDAAMHWLTSPPQQGVETATGEEACEQSELLSYAAFHILCLADKTVNAVSPHGKGNKGKFAQQWRQLAYVTESLAILGTVNPSLLSSQKEESNVTAGHARFLEGDFANAALCYEQAGKKGVLPLLLLLLYQGDIEKATKLGWSQISESSYTVVGDKTTVGVLGLVMCSYFMSAGRDTLRVLPPVAAAAIRKYLCCMDPQKVDYCMLLLSVCFKPRDILSSSSDGTSGADTTETWTTPPLWTPRHATSLCLMCGYVGCVVDCLRNLACWQMAHCVALLHMPSMCTPVLTQRLDEILSDTEADPTLFASLLSLQEAAETDSQLRRNLCLHAGQSMLSELKEFVGLMNMLVPADYYLPGEAPPWQYHFYKNESDISKSDAFRNENMLRTQVSGQIKKLLHLLFRFAADTAFSTLENAPMAGAASSVPEEDKPFEEATVSFIHLLWYLHVRDQLSRLMGGDFTTLRTACAPGSKQADLACWAIRFTAFNDLHHMRTLQELCLNALEASQLDQTCYSLFDLYFPSRDVITSMLRPKFEQLLAVAQVEHAPPNESKNGGAPYQGDDAFEAFTQALHDHILDANVDALPKHIDAREPNLAENSPDACISALRVSKLWLSHNASQDLGPVGIFPLKLLLSPLPTPVRKAVQARLGADEMQWDAFNRNIPASPRCKSSTRASVGNSLLAATGAGARESVTISQQIRLHNEVSLSLDGAQQNESSEEDSEEESESGDASGADQQSRADAQEGGENAAEEPQHIGEQACFARRTADQESGERKARGDMSECSSTHSHSNHNLTITASRSHHGLSVSRSPRDTHHHRHDHCELHHAKEAGNGQTGTRVLSSQLVDQLTTGSAEPKACATGQPSHIGQEQEAHEALLQALEREDLRGQFAAFLVDEYDDYSVSFLCEEIKFRRFAAGSNPKVARTVARTIVSSFIAEGAPREIPITTRTARATCEALRATVRVPTSLFDSVVAEVTAHVEGELFVAFQAFRRGRPAGVPAPVDLAAASRLGPPQPVELLSLLDSVDDSTSTPPHLKRAASGVTIRGPPHYSVLARSDSTPLPASEREETAPMSPVAAPFPEDTYAMLPMPEESETVMLREEIDFLRKSLQTTLDKAVEEQISQEQATLGSNAPPPSSVHDERCTIRKKRDNSAHATSQGLQKRLRKELERSIEQELQREALRKKKGKDKVPEEKDPHISWYNPTDDEEEGIYDDSSDGEILEKGRVAADETRAVGGGAQDYNDNSEENQVIRVINDNEDTKQAAEPAVASTPPERIHIPQGASGGASPLATIAALKAGELSELGLWLKDNVGEFMLQYEETLRLEGFERPEQLQGITADDLRDLQVKVAHRRQLLRAVDQLFSVQQPPPDGVTAPRAEGSPLSEGLVPTGETGCYVTKNLRDAIPPPQPMLPLPALCDYMYTEIDQLSTAPSLTPTTVVVHQAPEPRLLPSETLAAVIDSTSFRRLSPVLLPPAKRTPAVTESLAAALPTSFAFAAPIERQPSLHNKHENLSPPLLTTAAPQALPQKRWRHHHYRSPQYGHNQFYSDRDKAREKESAKEMELCYYRQKAEFLQRHHLTPQTGSVHSRRQKNGLPRSSSNDAPNLRSQHAFEEKRQRSPSPAVQPSAQLCTTIPPPAREGTVPASAGAPLAVTDRASTDAIFPNEEEFKERRRKEREAQDAAWRDKCDELERRTQQLKKAQIALLSPRLPSPSAATPPAPEHRCTDAVELRARHPDATSTTEIIDASACLQLARPPPLTLQVPGAKQPPRSGAAEGALLHEAQQEAIKLQHGLTTLGNMLDRTSARLSAPSAVTPANKAEPPAAIRVPACVASIVTASTKIATTRRTSSQPANGAAPATPRTAARREEAAASLFLQPTAHTPDWLSRNLDEGQIATLLRLRHGGENAAAVHSRTPQ
eukprot:TRINITY_DN3156_c0_g1_i2.p1 TRINITY_DN3156_c0_g1~~TRINITY_DN3156_c0_g1_i2.p1  ORF type:complete len:2372 (+),score=405.09 TRINITY_DN3156_c0_g1_i2:296-7411(+)